MARLKKVVDGRKAGDPGALLVFGGAALWGMDLFNEIWNSIVFHASGFAPVWGTPGGVGDTALLLLIEIFLTTRALLRARATRREVPT